MSLTYEQIQQLCRTIHPSIPVYEDTMALARLVPVDDLTPEFQVLRFQRAIGWVRQVGSGWRLMRGQTCLKEGPSFIDGRFCTSLGRALVDAQDQAKAMALPTKGNLRIEVSLVVGDQPTVPVFGPYVNRFDPIERQRLFVPKSLWLRDKPMLDVWVASKTEDRYDLMPLPWLDTHRVMAGEVWASTQPALTEDQIEALIQRWAAVLTPRAVTVPDDLAWRPNAAFGD
jgi:hypothetical protein